MTDDHQRGPRLASVPMRSALGGVQAPKQLPDPIRLLLVGDHALMRAGLRALIESRSGITVVGEASSCREAVDVGARLQPDIVLIDVDAQDVADPDDLSRVVTALDRARVLVLTGEREPSIHQHALRQGAMGVVIKDQDAELLRKAIERVHAGEAWVDRTTMGRFLERPSNGNRSRDNDLVLVEALTRRECEVASLVAEGLRNKEIGVRLSITETTVRHHLTAIFRKLGVSDRLKLLLYARQNKLDRLVSPSRYDR